MAEKKKQLATGAKGSRAEKMAHIVQGANKEYKRQVLSSSSSRTNDLLVVPRVTTSLYGLDVKTNGGYPFGRIVLLYGPKQGGKTTAYLRAVGEAQKLCANCHEPGEFERGTMDMPDLVTGKVIQIETDVMVGCPCGKPRDMIILWIDAEGVWLSEWSTKMGVLAEKVILMRPSFGEQAYDVITAFVSIKEIDVIVIDSLAALTPAVEYDAAMREQQQGAAARMNNKFIRKVVSGMNEAFQEGRAITLWMVNQYREKIGILFGSPNVLPGGKGQGFATSLEVEMRPGKMIIDKDSGEAILGEFSYKVKKNKIGVPGGIGKYQQCMSDNDLFSVGDIMEHEEVIAAACALDIIDRPSKVTYEYNGESYRGILKLVRYFGENPGEYNNMKDEMLRRKLGLDDD